MKKTEKVDWSFLSEIPELNQRIIVYDTETTGLNHFRHHILEIAAVEIENGKLTGKELHFYVKPRIPIDESAYKVNKIDQNLFADCFEEFYPEEKVLFQKFLDFIGEDSLILAHNATFDYYFLSDELMRLGLPQIQRERFRCSIRFMKKIANDSEIPKFTLENCCNFFKIKENKRDGNFHNALYDSFLTAKLVIKILQKYHGINEVRSNISLLSINNEFENKHFIKDKTNENSSNELTKMKVETDLIEKMKKCKISKDN